MTDNYLRIAKKILEARARPLTAQQILTDASRYGLLPEHLSGQTMQKTLQARIAEDIFNNRNESIFYRTKLGTYFLRELSGDATLPSKATTEFDRRIRVGRVPRHRLLTTAPPESPHRPVVSRDRYPLTAENTDYQYIWEISSTYVVLTMTIVFWRDCVLLHRPGKYSPFYSPDRTLSAGFRRYVDEYDVDLFVDDPTGIRMSAQREYVRVVGGQVAADTLEPEFIASYIDPEAKAIIFGVSVRIGGNTDYSGALRRRLDAPRLQWVSVASAAAATLDPISNALFHLASDV
jgi:hypothetical protein